MIQRIQITERDRQALSDILIKPEEVENDFYDYSKVVVKKPWGYEYLIFTNENIAVWILYLKKGAQTSMHCHPCKKTSLVVLEGEVVSSTISSDLKRRAGEGLLIDKAVFHRTSAASETGAFVMEIETPVNKRDLVRLDDKYGRVGKGYETEDQHSFNTQNYNYISFSSMENQLNLKKRFGQCTLTFMKLTDTRDFEKMKGLNPEDVICLLKGQLRSESGQPVIQIGDTLTVASLGHFEGLKAAPHSEMLIIKKIDHMIKVSDYIASFLSRKNLKPIFVVPGEANVHLLDSIGRHEGLSYICTQVEKSATHAVEAFSKLRSSLGVLVISSGASAAGAIPGVARAWVDSTPLLVISGQARTDQDMDGHVRQLGNKAIPIVELVKPITKYATKVTNPASIRYCLEKAAALAMEGRHGPVWLDLPIDIQGTMVDQEDLYPFDPKELSPTKFESDLPNKTRQVSDLLEQSSRPVILAGSGIRNSKVERELLALVDQLKIPVLTSRRGADLIADDHPFFFGRPGTYGQRSANFIIQNCDLLISIGCRLSIPLIGRNTRAFARNACKVVVDTDPSELKKPTVQPDLGIIADAGAFIREWTKNLPRRQTNFVPWIDRCKEWRQKFPPGSYTGPSLSFEKVKKEGAIYPLALLHSLSQELGENEVIVADGGLPLIYLSLAFQFKAGQRLISSTGLELPGFALAGSIGASVGCDRKPVVCLCEDRGFQINIQELQTVLDYHLPIKVMILKSRGHSIIRNIQRDYFGGRFVATDNEIRFGTAPLMQIARCFGFPTFEVSHMEQLPNLLKEWHRMPGPAICEVHVEDDQENLPRPGFTIRDDQKWIAKPLEDMYPLLDREVLKQNMIINLIQED